MARVRLRNICANGAARQNQLFRFGTYSSPRGGAIGLLFLLCGMLLLTGWLLQGLALVHALQRRLGVSIFWLVAMYAMLLFAMPYVIGTLAIAGFADSWIDFRARLGTVDKSDKPG